MTELADYFPRPGGVEAREGGRVPGGRAQCSVGGGVGVARRVRRVGGGGSPRPLVGLVARAPPLRRDDSRREKAHREVSRYGFGYRTTPNHHSEF